MEESNQVDNFEHLNKPDSVGQADSKKQVEPSSEPLKLLKEPQKESKQESTSNFSNSSKGNFSIKQASEMIKTKLSEALDKQANATISIHKEGDEWKADVEVVEEEYLPGKNLRSMNDLLGLYDVGMDGKGELTGWVKKKMYKRSQGL